MLPHGAAAQAPKSAPTNRPGANAQAGQPPANGQAGRPAAIGQAGQTPANAQTAQPADPNKPTGTTEDPPPEPKEEDQKELPTFDQMDLPTMAQLLAGPAIDWVVLKTKKVVVCESIVPRPNTLDAMNAKIKASQKVGGQRLPDEPSDAEEAKTWRRGLSFLQVSLLEGEEREFKLHMRFIQEIIHWEDLMLRRIDKLLDEKKVREAFELLNALYLLTADWPGAVTRQERIIFTEAAVKVDQGLLEESLALLEELHERNKGYPGLSGQLGVVVDRLMSAADAAKDTRRVRFFLKRLTTRDANHPVAVRWTKQMADKGSELLKLALAAERKQQPDVALDFIEQAQIMWPETPELTPAHRRIGNKFQRVRVGVLQLPAEDAASWLTHGSATDRQRQLTSRQLFVPSHFEDKIVRYRSPFFEEWEPTELGHNVVFRLRVKPQPWDSQPASTATPLALSLAARIDPDHPHFDERLASYVDGIRMPSPFELEVHFIRVPPRTEALFNFPLVATSNAVPDDQPDAGKATAAVEAIPGAGDQPSTPATPAKPSDVQLASASRTYPFGVFATDPGQVIYRRSIAEPELSTELHAVEVIEQRYPSSEKATQSLLRGDVMLLPSVRPWEVAKFEADGRFFVQPYAVPVTHLLQFNPRSKPLANRTLRRALAYGLSTKSIFEEVVLRGPAEKSERLGRLTSGPFPTTSYAYATTVEPYKYDPALAIALTAGAKKELNGELPTLRMICSADPIQRQAAQRLIDQWKRIRLTIELLPPPTANSPGSKSNGTDWDIAYRTVSLAEPLTELWSCLTLDAGTNAESLTLLPAWLRHELLTLDRAGDWDTAEKLLKNLHRHLWAEVQVIPLWEVNEFIVYRKNIRGLLAQPMTTYQGLERWRVEP
jgi:hypothetical protein